MTQEFKGTKGKWRAEKHVVSTGDYLIINENRFQVAIVDNEYIKDCDATKANAQLIAHAPEMLEMLKKCKKMADALNAHEASKEINELITKATTI